MFSRCPSVCACFGGDSLRPACRRLVVFIAASTVKCHFLQFFREDAFPRIRCEPIFNSPISSDSVALEVRSQHMTTELNWS